MIKKLVVLVLCCTLFVGCSSSKPQLEPINKMISGCVMLPNKTRLKNQRIILIADYAYPTARSIVSEIDKDGYFNISNTETPIYPIKYKVFVILSSPSDKKYIPQKYYDREDDESDLIIDLTEDSSDLVLRMNKS